MSQIGQTLVIMDWPWMGAKRKTAAALVHSKRPSLRARPASDASTACLPGFHCHMCTFICIWYICV